MPENQDFHQEELIRKYQWAGKIRALSFFLLLLFLFLMKTIGGYAYLNSSFIALVLVEAILNQPYLFILKRVNLRRFQYLQMATDIISVSWVIYYLGGVEAPLVTIAYYAVILWAGVVSSVNAAFFAVIMSALFYSIIVVAEYFGWFPPVSYYDYKMPVAQMYSLLVGNVSFMFAFGYFTTRSSNIIKSLEKNRQEESIKSMHQLTASGYLVGNIAHDLLNFLASIRGYIDMILETKIDRHPGELEMLQTVHRLERRSTDLLIRLARFSDQSEKGNESIAVSDIIEEAINLVVPIIKYINIAFDKRYPQDSPKILCNKQQFLEAFVAIILTSTSTLKDGDSVKISVEKGDMIHVGISDTGRGFSAEELEGLKSRFFFERSHGRKSGYGLSIVFDVMDRHKGRFEVKSAPGHGTRYDIDLPVVEWPESMIS